MLPDLRKLCWRGAIICAAASALTCQGIPTTRFFVDGGAVDAGATDGGRCLSDSIVSMEDIPDIYFVLDHSGSMADYNKWGTMQNVVAHVVNELGSTARFEATIFPAPDSACNPGVEVLPLQLGDRNGVLAAQLLQVTNTAPLGGTPTAMTLGSVLASLPAVSGRRYVILATDGGANCNAALTCSQNTCTDNLDGTLPQCQPYLPPNCCAQPYGDGRSCLDATATEAAVAALAAAGIPTYVVGIEGSAPYEAMLNLLAEKGGTARATAPYYYRVDSTDESALEMALAEIAARITASCTVQLTFAPDDLSSLVVQEGGVTIPQDPTNGWTLSGSTLSLHGTACDNLLSGEALGLTVAEGCSG